MIQQIGKGDGISTESENKRANQRQWRRESPMAKKKIGSASSDQIMKYKDGLNSGEKWQQGIQKVWGIKGPGLKICQ